MPTWATGINKRGAAMRGFTLIELLVVVVILAVLAGALPLAMGGLGGERQLEHVLGQIDRDRGRGNGFRRSMHIGLLS